MSDTIEAVERGFGFTMLDNTILFSGVSPGAKVCWAALRSYCSSGLSAFPSIGRLAEELGTSRSTVSRHIRELTDEGYLTIKARSGSSSVYTLKHSDDGARMSDRAVERLGRKDQPTSPKAASRQINLNFMVAGEHVARTFEFDERHPLSTLNATQWDRFTSSHPDDVSRMVAYIGEHGPAAPSGFRYDLPSTAAAKCLEGKWWAVAEQAAAAKDNNNSEGDSDVSGPVRTDWTDNDTQEFADRYFNNTEAAAGGTPTLELRGGRGDERAN